MKENVIDILKYLFESYIDEDIHHIPTDKSVHKELSLAGFNKQNINKAFKWLDDLALLKENLFEQKYQFSYSNRVYNNIEEKRFSTAARGFLYHLENKGLMDFSLRETIIEKSLALEIEEIDLELIQWVVLMVFYNISSAEIAFTWIEDMVFEETSIIH
jgi:Smg protein